MSVIKTFLPFWYLSVCLVFYKGIGSSLDSEKQIHYVLCFATERFMDFLLFIFWFKQIQSLCNKENVHS